MTILSDNFNRADSGTPGGSWIEVIAVAQLVSNQISATDPAAMYVHSTPCSTVNQYNMASFAGLADVNVNEPYFVFRYTDSSSPFYTVRFLTASDTVEWRSHTNAADTTGTLIDSSALTIGASATFSVTVDDAGSNTTARIWVGATGLPDNASSWGGDNTPDITLTGDPGSAVDTGNIVGWGWTTGNPFSMTMDNWFGGDSVQPPLVRIIPTRRPRPFAPGFAR